MSDAEDGLNDTFSNENSMDMIIRNIYKSCDENNTNRVHVSQLVEFIKPYMETAVSDLNKLKENLDPNDTDPEISSEVFHNIMNDWAKKCKQEDSFNNISPRHLENRPFVESTPRKSFGMRQQRVYAEAVAMNISVVEQASFQATDSNENCFEKSMLEDQIKQLTHQSRMYNDELLMARNQLLLQEEQNVGLQSELDKLTKDLKHEREINENLQRESKNFEEARENSFNKQKSIDKLTKDLQQLEKENQQLQLQISSLDYERQKTEEKMSHLHEKLSQSRKEAIELREEINMQEEQINIAEEVKIDLLSKIRELNDSVTNLQEANTCLKVEKEKVTKLLQENLKLQSQAALNFSAKKDQNHNSPPCMYVVPRTTDRKALEISENASFDESINDEEIVQIAFSSLANSAQASLMDELSAAKDSSPPSSSSMDSDRACANCSVQLEVKRRLDDLCDQIEWLKTENSTLRQSEVQIANLMQSKRQSEEIARSKDQRIEELNSTIVLIKDRESGLRKENAELTEKLSVLQKCDQDLRQKCDELAYLQNELKSVQCEREKLLLENSVDQSVNQRLKDDLKALEHTKKCLQLKADNLHAENEKLVEEQKNNIDDYAKQIQQSREDIAQLEEKFYASHDEMTSLLAERDEASTANAKLFFQNQKLQDAVTELQVELQHYTTIINGTCTKNMPTKQKLQLLLKSKDSLEKLEVRYENLIEAQKKESEELTVKVVQLEDKCSQLSNSYSKDTPKKTPHDRTQIKLEKLREKVEYLEETLRMQKTLELSLRKELEHLQKSYETLIKEKVELLKETGENQQLLETKQNSYKELVAEVKDMLSGTFKVRYNMLKFSKNRKSFVAQCDSVDSFVRHLEEVDNGHLTSHIDQVAQFDSAADTSVNPKELTKAKNDLQTIALILDALSIPSQSGRNITEEGKAVSCQADYLPRPMSPDSPNLGALDVITVTAAGDQTLQPLAREKLEEFKENDEALTEESNTEDEFDGLPFDALHKMYLPENLEFLITSFRMNDQTANAVDLEAFVDDFGLTFMVDCTGYKNRLRGRFKDLQAVVTRLVAHLQTYTSQSSHGQNAKSRRQAMGNIVKCLFELVRSAEQYGAIQQEMQASRNINQLMRHIIHLRDSTKPSGRNLRGETVHVDGIFTTSRSASQLCNISPQSRIMALLNAMRPSNVIRLVGVAVLTILVYYFSKHFVFMLAGTDSGGGDVYAWRRDAVCWSTWLDFLAACLGRMRSEGPTPI